LLNPARLSIENLVFIAPSSKLYHRPRYSAAPGAVPL